MLGDVLQSLYAQDEGLDVTGLDVNGLGVNGLDLHFPEYLTFTFLLSLQFLYASQLLPETGNGNIKISSKHKIQTIAIPC